MRPIAELSHNAASGIRGVFTDIDGTLTCSGRVTQKAYEALWRLHDAGIPVVPVTGRPAGWCDLMVRQWPVAGVIGENGALAYYEQDGRVHRMYHPKVDAQPQQRLEKVRRTILSEVEGSRVASDQAFRMFDLAIDFCEDPPDLGLKVAVQIKKIFEHMGAQAKISNIHVNGWFGDYDKLSMVQHFCKQRWMFDIAQAREDFIFCGDSPNDEPMFAYFPNACGVANVQDFTASMRHLPKWLSAFSGGDGFADMVDILIERRQST